MTKKQTLTPEPTRKKAEIVMNIWDKEKNMKSTLSKDRMVAHPDHYAVGKYECIDVMHDLMSRKVDVLKEATYDWGTAFKYLWRVGEKADLGLDGKQKTVQDLEKAKTYIQWAIDTLNGEKLTK